MLVNGQTGWMALQFMILTLCYIVLSQNKSKLFLLPFETPTFIFLLASWLGLLLVEMAL